MSNFNKIDTETIKKHLLQHDDEKFVNWELSSYDFFYTKDNYIFELEKASKITIRKTMYYDDETEAPKINFDNFYNYNDDVFVRIDWLKEQATHDYMHFYIAHNNICDEKIVNVLVLEDWAEEYRKKNIIREMDTDEINEYIDVMENRATAYLERLKKYFNRYNKHITTYGYWANR